MTATERILVLAPHTDDGELGCGGTIAKEVMKGSDVRYVAFSSAGRSLPEGYPQGTLVEELLEATKILGIPEKSVSCRDYDVRNFDKKRQDILEDMHDLREELSPDIVFAPSLNDLHQDHRVIAEEARRMFKHTSMLGYEMPWNNISFDTHSFSVLEKMHIDAKIKALGCYKSQGNRTYMNGEFIMSLARMRGGQVAATFAEAFEVVRWIVR